MDGDQRIEQLERDLAEAIERQAATSQVLEVIGRSRVRARAGVRDGPAPGGPAVPRRRRADPRARRRAPTGWPPRWGDRAEYRDYLRSVPIVPGPGTLVGRVGQERRTVQIPDVLADPDYRMHRARELGGFRTILGVPMLAAERVVGVMVLWRHKVAPFDARTIGLVTTFAAQGAIAIQNVAAPARAAPARARARPLRRRAARAGRDQPGGRLDAGPRRGADDDRHARGAALGRRRRLDLRVPARRAGVRAAHVLRHQRGAGGAAARHADRRSRRPSSAGPRPSAPRSRHPTSRSEAPDPHINALLEARLALDARRPAAARGRDRRRADRAAHRARRVPGPHRRAAGDAGEPVGRGDPQRAPVLASSSAQVERARGRGSAQVRVPGVACRTSCARR